MLRMRVEAAASAKCARSAPWVMEPASATWRNRLRSVRSKRMADFVCYEGWLQKSQIVLGSVYLHLSSEAKHFCNAADPVRMASLASAMRAPALRHAPSSVTTCSSGNRRSENNGRRQGNAIERPPALPAPANLPADADDDDVDRASHHGR